MTSKPAITRKRAAQCSGRCFSFTKSQPRIAAQTGALYGGYGSGKFIGGHKGYHHKRAVKRRRPKGEGLIFGVRGNREKTTYRKKKKGSDKTSCTRYNQGVPGNELNRVVQ